MKDHAIKDGDLRFETESEDQSDEKMETNIRVSAKRLKSSAAVNQKAKQHFQESHEAAKRGETILWTWPNCPVELFWAMDFFPLFNVHYSSLVAAKQLAPYYIERAEERGYGRDLCGYCSKNFLGYVFNSNLEQAPWGGMARPKLLVTSNPCDPLTKVWELVARELSVPLFVIDKTYPAEPPELFPLDEKGIWDHEGDVRCEQLRVDYYVETLKELIVFLETHTGKKLEEDRLRQAVQLSAEAWYWFAKCGDLRRAHPCPISSSDWLPQIVAPLYFRGTEWAVEHTKKLYFEIKERVDHGIGAVDKERYRLLWIGHPTWFSPGFINSFEEEYGAVFVWENYHLPTWFSRMDATRPLESIAKNCMDQGGEIGMAAQCYGEMFLPAARIPGNVQGAIIVIPQSCKMLTSGVLYYQRELERAGVPSMQLLADMVDPRDWDDNRMHAQVASFIETLTPIE